MGIQDRDYWREKWIQRERDEERAERSFRIFSRKSSRSKPRLRDVPGANMHWTLQLMVWLAILVLILAAMRLLR